jgi:hypothetical protein
MNPPIDHPLNLGAQAVFVWASWGLTVALIGVAIRMGLKERTPFYILLLLAVMTGAFAEPLYDEGLMLYFYAPGIWSHFSAFGVPQPYWTHSGYAVLYGSVAMVLTRQIHRGALSRRAFYGWAGVEIAMSSAFEITGINTGVYEYWGPHVFRIFGYPLIIPVLEACQVLCLSVAAAQLRARTTQPAALFILFPLFLMTFYLANFGAGAPVIVALHLDTLSPGFVALGTLVSIAFAFTAVRMAASFIAAAPRNAMGRSTAHDRTAVAL